jgi:hypothetical protein
MVEIIGLAAVGGLLWLLSGQWEPQPIRSADRARRFSGQTRLNS